MSKNIILCADGTGNKGGYTPDSNVYKMYNAIEIHDTKVPQYTYYDNGVGTSTNKYWRAITGAVGIGIKANIIDLYRFLALHYVEGDKVYLFGFSRGAATIRAFCGFINAVGLVNGNGLSDQDLKDYTKDAFKAYENHKKDKQRAKDFYEHRHSNGIIDIQFVGVWDTVSALGFPKRTDKMGFSLTVLSYFFSFAETISNIFWPHQFYNYDLSKNIQFAYQALSIDDERTAFWPHVWDEVTTKRTEQNVEQVWFSGMHSNVGGGYERQGMANVTLHWMMLRAEKQGMVLKPGVLDQAYDDSNIHGRLYDSRDGLAIYYRYHPRNIKNLCDKKLLGNIKVHKSTLERLRKRTGNYTPVVLPDKFEVAESGLQTNPPSTAQVIDMSNDEQWTVQNNIVNKGINFRKKLYGTLVNISVIVVLYVVYFTVEIMPKGFSLFGLVVEGTGLSNFLATFLTTMFENHLPTVVIFILWILYLIKKRKSVKTTMTKAAEKIRQLIVGHYTP